MGLVENVKEAVKIVQQIDNIELYRKILDLQGEAIELIEKLKEKDEIIKNLKSAFELKGKLKCKHSAYWKIEGEDEIVDGPFCTKCWDVDRILCRLINGTKPKGMDWRECDWWQCPTCKIPFHSWAVNNDLKELIDKGNVK